MSQLGVGVMIRQLCGNKESVDVFRAGIGKKITALRLGDDDALHFEFDDGYKMKLLDNGQSCCETRYMRTDDDLQAHVGSILRSAEVADGPSVEDEQYGADHETQFLKVDTTYGTFTMVSHNEHNGYYGGFSIEACAE